MLGEKIAELAGSEFKPEMVTDWLRNCYTEATALVDEHGTIKGKNLNKVLLAIDFRFRLICVFWNAGAIELTGTGFYLF